MRPSGLFRRSPDLRLAVPLEGLPVRHGTVVHGLNAPPVSW